MKIVIGSDHRGIDLKAKILEHLSKKKGIEYQDFGPTSQDPVDYPDYGFPVAETVSKGEAERGILICGSGLGMSYVANKVPGIIGALCTSVYQAEMSRRHNDANLLCLAADITPVDDALKMLDVWLTTGFDGDRHERRVQKILNYERQHP